MKGNPEGGASSVSLFWCKVTQEETALAATGEKIICHEPKSVEIRFSTDHSSEEEQHQQTPPATTALPPPLPRLE
ncbi:hypothetical protein E2C01_059792 [Portunus trituberculatus]|uniref:Uncharacterized protein n=1 Tax=Portunus trituberculatus TaxID=210409 RepID=A0A5B7HA96_PORTR|nr:hypothetical protein [Portunus trituberculatus]